MDPEAPFGGSLFSLLPSFKPSDNSMFPPLTAWAGRPRCPAVCQDKSREIRRAAPVCPDSTVVFPDRSFRSSIQARQIHTGCMQRSCLSGLGVSFGLTSHDPGDHTKSNGPLNVSNRWALDRVLTQDCTLRPHKTRVKSPVGLQTLIDGQSRRQIVAEF